MIQPAPLNDDILSTNSTDDHGDCIQGSPKSSNPTASIEQKPPFAVDFPRMERAVREILAAVGEDPDREGLLETPGRVARMYAELFQGLHLDPRRHLRRFSRAI